MHPSMPRQLTAYLIGEPTTGTVDYTAGSRAAVHPPVGTGRLLT